MAEEGTGREGSRRFGRPGAPSGGARGRGAPKEFGGRRDGSAGRGGRGGGKFDGDSRGRPHGNRRQDGSAPAERRGGDTRRPDEPPIPDDVEAGELPSEVRRDLLSLERRNAETVARHMVLVSRLLDDDPDSALVHARAARQRAGRIAVVRETAGIAAYHAGEWAEALAELRAARRMSGGPGLLAVMADCERGLGRPERAIELGRSEEALKLTGEEATELRIVVAGARGDLGQLDAAVVTLQTPELDPARTGAGAARLFYAYADALLGAGRRDDAMSWFLNAAAADLDGDTDAEERAADLSAEGE